MFDLSAVIDLLKVEPGHGLVQSVLLFMIWLSAKGLKKEVQELKEVVTDLKIGHDERIKVLEHDQQKTEIRLVSLEQKGAR